MAKIGTRDDVYVQRNEIVDVVKVASSELAPEALPEVASAEELVVVPTGPTTTVKVTGSTQIKKIAAIRAGLIIVLVLTGAATVSNGENLKLVASYSGLATRVLTLVSDGTNFQEVTRDPAPVSTPLAQEALAESTGKTPSTTRNALVTGQIETATATRTKIKILVGAVIVLELVAPVSSTGTSLIPFSFMVPANQAFKWEKIEGTVEASGFKFSSTLV